jgi:hypothetical protein
MMSDDKTYLTAVAETCERLHIEPKDLLGYVLWLRKRYAQCVEALLDIREFSTDTQAAELAYETLLTVGAIEEKEGEDVS